MLRRCTARLSALVLAALLWAAPASAQVAFVQQATGTNISDAGTVAFGSNVTSGSGLFACVAFSGVGTTLDAITDTRSNAWSRSIRYQDNTSGNEQTVEIWQAASGSSGANTLSFDFSMAVVAAQISLVEVSGFTNGITLDDSSNGRATASTTANHGSVTSTVNDAFAFACGRSISAFNVTNVGDSFSALTYGARKLAHYRVLSSTATFDADLTFDAAETFSGVLAVFVETSLSNSAPTVSMDTADEQDFGTDTTPTLLFTGSDDDDDDLTYEIEITDNPENWAGGSILVDEYANSVGTRFTIHTSPVGGTTWEGHRQVDDRPGQAYQSKGGILDRIEFRFSAFESDASKTDGSYLVSVYTLDGGVRGDSTLAPWASTTAYSLNQIVKQTSGANANQQFLYQATTAGTSDSSEPTWTEVENDTFNDGTVVWTGHRGAGPLNPAAAASTPTPGWLARSDVTDFDPDDSTEIWGPSDFSGDQRIRGVNGNWYAAILDWRPDDTDSDNGLTVVSREGGVHNGNAYIDGASTGNNGPRVGADMPFRVYESFSLIEASSDADAGFANVDDGGDADPFTAGDQISFTLQAPLAPGVYRWRVRVVDPSGSNVFSEWSSPRTFTIDEEDDEEPVLSTGCRLLLLGVGGGCTVN